MPLTELQWCPPHRRVQKFRTDYTELRTQFERFKAEVSTLHSLLVHIPTPPAPTQHEASTRAELLSGSSSSTGPMSAPGDTRRRFMAGQPPADEVSESPFRGPSPMLGHGTLREQHALHEHSFIQNTDTRLDEFIAQGRAVLDDLVEICIVDLECGPHLSFSEVFPAATGGPGTPKENKIKLLYQ